MINPLHQFEVHKILPLSLAGVDISITNSSLCMMIAVVVTSFFLIGGMSRAQLIPGKWQSITELTYKFVANLLDENVGLKGQKFFPFIFSIFMFVMMGNLIGMVPYSFTFTSQLIVTSGLAAIVFVFVTILGFIRHGLKFFTLFLPSGVPVFLIPMIVPIEIISYLSRPITLAVRLFANMMAGHTLLKVFGAFTVAMGVFGIAPLVANIIFTAFEIFIALLQAYVFTILTCIYLEDAINLH